MREHLARGLRSRWAPYWIFGLVVVVMFWLRAGDIHHNSEQVQTQIDRLCASAQANRQVLSDVVFAAYQSGEPPDFTRLPHYQEYDASTMLLLQDLTAASASETADPTDENGNHVPDAIEKILARPVC